jgi:hypothetical protein
MKAKTKTKPYKGEDDKDETNNDIMLGSGDLPSLFNFQILATTASGHNRFS